jgi:hypothetical protein
VKRGVASSTSSWSSRSVATTGPTPVIHSGPGPAVLGRPGWEAGRTLSITVSEAP